MHTQCSSVVFDVTVRSTTGMEYLVKGLLDYASPRLIVLLEVSSIAVTYPYLYCTLAFF